MNPYSKMIDRHGALVSRPGRSAVLVDDLISSGDRYCGRMEAHMACPKPASGADAVPEPVNGAGVVSSDPPQDGLSQDPTDQILSELDELPEYEPAVEVVNDVTPPAQQPESITVHDLDGDDA